MEQTGISSKEAWNWIYNKPNNVLITYAGPNTGFFEWWCAFQRPLVNLTDKELKVVASLLRHRYELSKKIPDQDILDKLTMSREVAEEVIKDCNMSKQHLYVIMSGLKKKKVITENGLIEPKLIPNIRATDNGCFQYLLLFKDPEFDPQKNNQSNEV